MNADIDEICPNHTYALINTEGTKSVMHFCDHIEISRHDGEIVERYKQSLITQTKKWGVVDYPDGTQTIGLKLSFEGTVNNVCGEIEYISASADITVPVDTWGIREASRLYKEGREAWLKGDFKTVAELFGVLVLVSLRV